jgi:alkylation response protein AidB-like acyl-CoA dehydrogenase
VRMGDELALVVVDRATAGLTIESMPALDATRRLCAVTFDGVAVIGGSVLATGECAEAALERTLDVGTAGLLMEMVGGMQRLLEITVEYAKTRKQFGKPIGQFQAVQHLCADMFLLTESSRSAAYGAVSAIGENRSDAGRAVSVAKVYAGDAYREVGNRAIQVHGGMGFTWESDLHLYYRRAKAAETLFGDAGYHRERIAREVVD